MLVNIILDKIYDIEIENFIGNINVIKSNENSISVNGHISVYKKRVKSI